VFLASFVRGDATANSVVSIDDAIEILNILFVAGTPWPGCLDSCDVNDDGSLGLADVTFLLLFLFSGGATIPSPFPDCGTDDMTPFDDIDCTADNANCI
jgi:hypothetical protein